MGAIEDGSNGGMAAMEGWQQPWDGSNRGMASHSLAAIEVLRPSAFLPRLSSPLPSAPTTPPENLRYHPRVYFYQVYKAVTRLLRL